MVEGVRGQSCVARCARDIRKYNCCSSRYLRRPTNPCFLVVGVRRVLGVAIRLKTLGDSLLCMKFMRFLSGMEGAPELPSSVRKLLRTAHRGRSHRLCTKGKTGYAAFLELVELGFAFLLSCQGTRGDFRPLAPRCGFVLGYWT